MSRANVTLWNRDGTRISVPHDQVERLDKLGWSVLSPEAKNIRRKTKTQSRSNS